MTPLCSPVALYLVSTLAPQPAPPPAEPPLAARTLASLAQGTVIDAAPTWFVAVSGNYVQADFIGPLGDGDDQFNAFGVDFGFTRWDDQLGVTIEAGYLGSSMDVETSSIGTENVDTTRLLVGLRLADRGQSWWLPYLRGGYMWRQDSGDTIDESGNGFYVGGGFDFFLGQHLRIGPQLLYTESESLDTKEWILGGVLSFGF